MVVPSQFWSLIFNANYQDITYQHLILQVFIVFAWIHKLLKTGWRVKLFCAKTVICIILSGRAPRPNNKDRDRPTEQHMFCLGFVFTNVHLLLRPVDTHLFEKNILVSGANVNGLSKWCKCTNHMLEVASSGATDVSSPHWHLVASTLTSVQLCWNNVLYVHIVHVTYCSALCCAL